MSAAGSAHDGPADPRIALLLATLEGAFKRHGWHGPTLWNTVEGVNLDSALWRPAPGRHNIWEIALHTAYWKYIARRRLAGGLKRGAFPRRGSNFPALPDPATEAAWAADRALLREEHDRLRDAVRAFPPARLDRPVGSGAATAAATIFGVAAHDAYHAGQIRLIHRMMEEIGTPRTARRSAGR